DDQDYQESDKTRASNAEDFPNFRDFQIVKMVQHFRVVTDGSQEQLRLGFKCKTCGTTFNKTMQLLGHIRLHFEDEHTCRDCGKYFFDPNKLQVHIKAKHTINMLKCQLGCPRYSTPSFKCLQLHYERFHFVKIRMRELRKMDEAIRNGGTVMTQIISKKQQRKQLRTLEALRSGSSGEDSQGAEDDGYDDDDDGSEKVLSETAEENALYDDQMQCCVCGAIFEEEQQLEQHENSHTAPLECSFCSMTFLQLPDIRAHYQARHQAISRPSQQYVIAHPSGSLVQQKLYTKSAANGAMTTMLVMQNGMLIPVHAIDSAQLTAVNPYQHQQAPTTTLTPIAQSPQIAWPITATPIATTHHHHQQQQILPPVHNQIEIIPLHSSPQAGGGG
ncbi:AGAP008134-PA, partial [Anopheles gambiae str. PEST]